ncbi:MAG: hypothetical protein KC502_05535 [Myxococcales bacterium]|nr:hypothetical protein [Myxococcales bacterium]
MGLPTEPSMALQAGFIGLSLCMAVFVAWWTQRRRLVAGWVFVTGGLSIAGVLSSFDPPRLPLLLFPGLIALTVLAWRSDWHLKSIRLIVGFQAFRILVELLIHQAVVEGVAPPQFTWTGLNWDVATGVLALLLIPVARRLPVWALHVFNLVGWGLLLNVMTVAVLSMPTPFQQIQPDNVWVGFFPFTWLPLILVMAAWLGHVVLLKKLRVPSR